MAMLHTVTVFKAVWTLSIVFSFDGHDTLLMSYIYFAFST